MAPLLNLLFCMYTVVFNMFDKNGSGTINKKEFRDMAMILIKGEHTVQVDEFESQFKGLSKLMADSAMALYDTNKDGKLSFEEWLVYTEHDEDVQRCLSCIVKSTISPRLLVER